jgi:hypothetical protein
VKATLPAVVRQSRTPTPMIVSSMCLPAFRRARRIGQALRGGWSVWQLDRQVSSLVYERIALSKNKATKLEKAETAVASNAITPKEAIKDLFVLARLWVCLRALRSAPRPEVS